MRRARVGIDAELEAKADALIFAATKTQTKQSDKADVLTPWKERDRLSHEVYPASGIADPSAKQGTFTRVYNPVHVHLNSREGVAGLNPRGGTSPQSAFMVETGNPGAISGGTSTDTHFHPSRPHWCNSACRDSR